jgi:hypothetical protein
MHQALRPYVGNRLTERNDVLVVSAAIQVEVRLLKILLIKIITL